MRLRDLISTNLDSELSEPVQVLADVIHKQHGPGVLAVLAYGSCLRGTPPTDSLIDYYVLTDTSAAISRNPISQVLCNLVPPNVYFAEHLINGTTYRAKYAALTLETFKRKVAPETTNPYFWARFSQPVAVVYCRDDAAREDVLLALDRAVRTMFTKITTLTKDGVDTMEVWSTGLRATYASELRSEGPERARHIVEANADYYISVSKILGNEGAPSITQPNWPRVQRLGKLLSVARLLKAGFTFRGGPDYLAWKIARHSGQPIELTDWQRRHPFLAAFTLLPKLLKSGAVR